MAPNGLRLSPLTQLGHGREFHVAVATPEPRLCFTTLTRGDRFCHRCYGAGGVMRVFALLFVALFLSNGSALAASQQDYQDCNAAGGDRTIAACTRIAEDPGAPADERYVLLLRRGVAYL